MIEANNPEIDVDELMQKIREEVVRRQKRPTVDEGGFNALGTISSTVNHIEALLRNAESKSQVRTEIPKKFEQFPFNASRRLLRFALKLYAFLFKEQRAVNLSLIQALGESLALNRQLVEQVTSLRVLATEMSDRLTEMGDRLTSVDERYLRNDFYLKNDLAQQKRLITLFLEAAQQRLPEPFNREQMQSFVNEERHLLDAFYLAFEEQFRGSREDIRSRLKVYLPLFEEVKVGTSECPILDVGCGRGEWLELLREAGYTAKGIDVNRAMLEQCRSRELDVAEADVVAYLKSLPDASLGAVTGFHIIEHLPFSVLLEVLSETIRVLKSGGLVIFETPNPQNILVGSHNFYMDPTHRHPLPSTLTQFLLEHAGFAPVEIKNLNPYADSYKISGSEIAERFNDYFYGPQDYAIVGYKV